MKKFIIGLALVLATTIPAQAVKVPENVQKFINLSNDKRHTTLIELGYFKSQIQRYERQIAGLISKKKNSLRETYEAAIGV